MPDATKPNKSYFEMTSVERLADRIKKNRAQEIRIAASTHSPVSKKSPKKQG
jgi:hypothetical protein